MKLATAFVAVFSFFTPTAFAEKIEWQGYEIHYATFTSTLIPAEIAEAHGITRSESRIITNITIRQDGKPVKTALSGTATNLLNQLFTLEFNEVTEESAVYYLASQVIDERDTIRFSIDIHPGGHTESYKLVFTRQYYEGARQ